MKFRDYAAAGFTTELLPILPPDAVVNPSSPQLDNLEASRGKVPGRKGIHGWSGFAKWTGYDASDSDVDTWHAWGAGIGLQGRIFPGLDIDVEESRIADVIERCATVELGLAPCRFGRGARRLLPYSGSGFKKRRLAFRLPGGTEGLAAQAPGAAALRQGQGGSDLLDHGGRGADAPAAGIVHAVELLGQGQQYLVAGIHPKTVKPYYWRDGVSPAELTAAGLTPITPEELDAFFEAVEWYLVNVLDAEIVENAKGGSSDAGAADQTGLLAPSLSDLERALSLIGNDT